MTLILIVTGAVLVYLIQNRLYQKYWNKSLYVSVDFEKKQAVRGEQVNLIEVVTNNKILPLSMLCLKFDIDKSFIFADVEDSISVSDKCYKNDIFSLLFYQKITRTLPFVCTNRGFFTITKANLVSSNLFLNIQFAESIPLYTEITVFPDLADGGRLEIPYRKMMGELLSKRCLYEDPFEFSGIREYSTTDTMSSINWKASARTGDLRVNVHGHTASQEICILLDLESEIHWQADKLLEECISIAAGLCDKFISSGVGIRLISNGCDIYSKQPLFIEGGVSASHMDTILTALARIDLKLSPAAFTGVLDKLIAKETGNTLYILVSVAYGDKLSQFYETLAQKSTFAMWILPYSFKPQFDIKMCPSVEIVPWEVTANEK